MKLKKELTLKNLILDTENLAQFINKAASHIDVINQSNDLELIKQELKEPENYAILKQVAELSDYLDELSGSVAVKFIDYVMDHKINPSDSQETSPLLNYLIAAQLMYTLYESNQDLYNLFSQPVENMSRLPFDVSYEPHLNPERDKVIYQFQFNPQKGSWDLYRFLPGNSEGEIINTEKNYVISKQMKTWLNGITPETLNPFIQKCLFKTIESTENYKQKKEQKKLLKKTFDLHINELSSKIENHYQSILKNVPELNKINFIHTTFFENVEKKPKLMVDLLLVDGIFELKNNFNLISFLAKSIEWDQLKALLDKESIQNALLKADFYALHVFSENFPIGLSKLSKIYFEKASKEQLNNLEGYLLSQWAKSLSKDDFVKFRKEGKIRLEYPEYSHSIVELYKNFPEDFSNILEEMISSGKSIGDLPRDAEIFKHYVDLFLKYKGEWFNLIPYRKGDVYNHRADLLAAAMQTNPEKTVEIIKSLSVKDSLGNNNFPASFNAEEIAKIIAKSPLNACVLLDYKNILDSLRDDSFSFKPYGKIRHFDHIYQLLRGLPASYGEKLLRNGLLFPEKGMPHFHHLSGLGLFGGKNPSGSIEPIFSLLYKNLPCSTFMDAVSEGLEKNSRVNRLFFMDIWNINLMDLSKVLIKFDSIKDVEIALELIPDNRKSIIQFFDGMKKTNPELKFHIKVKLSRNKDEFEFLKNYLTETNSQIITLTIIPEDYWVKSKLLDKKKPEFKQFFDNCLKTISENNPFLQKISINGLSKSMFSENSEEYQFKELPLFNTKIFAIDNTDGFHKLDKNEQSGKLLLRNKNIHALYDISTKIRHFQNVLELLPWLQIKGLPAEIMVKIFDRLNYQHSSSKKFSPYLSILKTIENSKKLEEEAKEGHFISQLASGLIKMEGLLKVKSMEAYYRYKPQNENIDILEKFFDFEKLQNRVVEAITDWFIEERRPDLPELLSQFDLLSKALTNLNAPSHFTKELSKLPLVLELDGIPTLDSNQASLDFCSVKSDLQNYQKAIKNSLKNQQNEAVIALQCHGPLKKALWKDLSLKSFDGIEMLAVLKQYDPHKDVYQSSNWLKKIGSHIFKDLDSTEKVLFNKILVALNKYLNQKEKPIEKQCDKHKHQHKNHLFELIKPENIEIYKESKPRLYQILETQRERLANSISKCSVKILLKHSGLFSNLHEQKKAIDKEAASTYEEQINNRIAQLH
ncbi:MAG: hypothetical protein H0U57_12285 [Tatlockia sp.]|nr:hypothetical protein [Tatlockia sp.]